MNSSGAGLEASNKVWKKFGAGVCGKWYWLSNLGGALTGRKADWIVSLVSFTRSRSGRELLAGANKFCGRKGPFW